jgi:hypothetical protein
VTKRKRTAHRAPKLFMFYVKRRSAGYSPGACTARIRAERMDVSPSGMILFYRGAAITNMVSQALVSSVNRKSVTEDVDSEDAI